MKVKIGLNVNEFNKILTKHKKLRIYYQWQSHKNNMNNIFETIVSLFLYLLCIVKI